ncbi:glycosyltransferase family 4 protein [Thermosipho sp. 1070]|uniref:glycosyltransferase family 4 protein n=1 Tax=Thermosipho sp. 1070 TaxID=1437364 RepID=UPI0009494010|nr:glycosyltransferase family 4 protein [Thermosipho sp. 1070]ANQ53655.1 glycosyl transferase family 1 [Thermosipho sp. 1070]
MNILLVTQHFYPEQFRINDVFFELSKRGHSITVLTGLPNYPQGKILKDYRFFKNRKQIINGVKILRVPLISRGKSLFRLSLNYISFAISSYLRALFVKKDFDIIIGHQTSPITQVIAGVLLKQLAKKPFIIYCFDLWPASLETVNLKPDNVIYKILSKVSNWIYRRADYILMSSYSFKKYFNEYHGIYSNLIYLPMYAESIYENVNDSSKKINDKFNLLFAGNIGKMQSIDTIIKAAEILKRYNDIVFHIVGDGSEREKAEKLSKDLGLQNVIFHGFHKVNEMKKFYEMADACLVTLKKNEIISYTLPGKVQSYMAAGKPIVGAIEGETKEIIEKANCGLCGPAEDYKTLANNILKLYNDEKLRKLYSENAKKFYKKYFSKDIYFKRLECILNNVLEDKNIKGCDNV